MSGLEIVKSQACLLYEKIGDISKRTGEELYNIFNTA